MTRDTKALLLTGVVLLLGAFAWREVQPQPWTPADLLASAPRGGEAVPSPGVAIVFAPQDCGTLIESLRFWNAPFRSGAVRVTGWLYGEDAGEESLRRVANGVGIEFPVHRVSGSSLRPLQRSLGYVAESFVLVLDSRGRVRFAIPLSELSSPEARVHALALAKSLD